MKKNQKEFLWISLIATVIYCLVFVWFTQPLVSFSNTGYIGFEENGDAHQYYWNIFNLEEQIHQFKNPFYSNYIFAPEGTSMVMHTYTPILGLFSLVIDNNILALNIFLFLNFILSAIGAYLLCYKYNSNPILSISAGIVYAFCPYKILHLIEHYHLLFTAAVPFFILSFLKAFEFYKGGFFPKVINKKYVLYCFVLGVILFLSDYYATFSILYFCLFYALYYKFVAGINYRSLKFWVITIAILVVCHILLHQFKVHGVNNKGALWWSGDLWGYIIPHFNSQWLYNDRFAQIEKAIYHYPGSVEYSMFLGYSVLLLLVVFIVWLFNHSLTEGLKPIAFLALVFFLMTVPDLKFGGKSLFNLPLSFFHYIPFFNNIRSPTRMLPMVALCFMPLGLYVISSLISRRPQLNYVIGFVLIMLLVIEYKPVNYPIVKVSAVPEVINKLKIMPSGNLLYIPFGVRDGFIEQGKFQTKKLWYQTIHGKPLIDGYISRLSSATKEKFKAEIFSVMDSMQTDRTYVLANVHFNLPVRYILVEPEYRSNFEAFFDEVLNKKRVNSKLEIDGYLLYKVY